MKPESLCLWVNRVCTKSGHDIEVGVQVTEKDLTPVTGVEVFSIREPYRYVEQIMMDVDANALALGNEHGTWHRLEIESIGRDDLHGEIREFLKSALDDLSLYRDIDMLLVCGRKISSTIPLLRQDLRLSEFVFGGGYSLDTISRDVLTLAESAPMRDEAREIISRLRLPEAYSSRVNIERDQQVFTLYRKMIGPYFHG